MDNKSKRKNEIDIDLLTEKVYKLFSEDAKASQRRQGKQLFQARAQRR
jgi:hypothetical protein